MARRGQHRVGVSETFFPATVAIRSLSELSIIRLGINWEVYFLLVKNERTTKRKNSRTSNTNGFPSWYALAICPNTLETEDKLAAWIEVVINADGMIFCERRWVKRCELMPHDKSTNVSAPAWVLQAKREDTMCGMTFKSVPFWSPLFTWSNSESRLVSCLRHSCALFVLARNNGFPLRCGECVSVHS